MSSYYLLSYNLDPSIAAVSLFALTGLLRSFFTITNHFDLRTRSTIYYEIIQYTICPAFSEGKIVLSRSALVCMTFQPDPLSGISCQITRVIS